MIPRCHPSSINATTGRRQMRIYYLSSVAGLTRWVDYIPVKQGTSLLRPNSYDTGGYILTEVLTSTTGLQSWVDYVPVYEDNSATDAWQCSGNGYIVVDQTAFTPASLFSSGEQGAWYDPSDFSTMFQDSAGTTPVTAAGQPVGKILDKSGRANHATQATTANRPTLQQDGSGYYYLSFNGTNSTLASTSTVNLSTTNQVTMCAGLNRAGASQAVLASFGQVAVNTGAFEMEAPFNNTNQDGLVINDPVTAATVANTVLPAPGSSAFVHTGLFDRTQANANQIISRFNSVQQTPSTYTGAETASGTNFGNLTLMLGNRSGQTLFYNGRLYQFVLRGAITTGTSLTNLERFVGSKQGIAL